jgi:hypothetical protein
MRFLFGIQPGKPIPFDRFLTKRFGTDSSQAAAMLNDFLQRGHMRFEPSGDDVTLAPTEAGLAWLAEQLGDEPGGLIALEDQADAELRDLTEDDESD